MSILKLSQKFIPRRKTLARVLLEQTQALGILNTVMQKKLNTLQLKMDFKKVQKLIKFEYRQKVEVHFWV